MLQQWLVSSRRACPLRSGKQIYLQFSNRSALCLTELFSNQEFQLLCSLIHCSVLLFWDIYELFDALFLLRDLRVGHCVTVCVLGTTASK